MRTIHSLCVFCGSSPGRDITFAEDARKLGRVLATNNIKLVYGGSNIGLMRIIADEVLLHGGEVAGVMPHSLINREVAHKDLSEFHVVNTMSERKLLMADMSDAFIAMPGGIGTLDELFEVMSWNQLDLIDKPVALLNSGGFYDHLVYFLQQCTDALFIRPEHLSNLIVESDPVVLLERMKGYIPQKPGSKWINDLKSLTGERQ